MFVKERVSTCLGAGEDMFRSGWVHVWERVRTCLGAGEDMFGSGWVHVWEQVSECLGAGEWMFGSGWVNVWERVSECLGAGEYMFGSGSPWDCIWFWGFNTVWHQRFSKLCFLLMAFLFVNPTHTSDLPVHFVLWSLDKRKIHTGLCSHSLVFYF
jgi:hypothetical protein